MDCSIDLAVQHMVVGHEVPEKARQRSKKGKTSGDQSLCHAPLNGPFLSSSIHATITSKNLEMQDVKILNLYRAKRKEKQDCKIKKPSKISLWERTA